MGEEVTPEESILSYNNGFYKAYEEYLKEAMVRKQHDFVFSIVRQNSAFDKVIDLGCGQSREFYVYVNPLAYLGIDINAQALNIHRGDYRSGEAMDTIQEFGPSAFVSLFSAEITASVEQNYILYEQLFRCSTIKMGLVSGFFYSKRKESTTVAETGGVQSYQTLESIESVVSSTFLETRIILPVPSHMFGDDVFEIWKIFERR